MKEGSFWNQGRWKDREVLSLQAHLPGSGCGEEASRSVWDPLLDAGIAKPVHQPLAEQAGLVCGWEAGRDNMWEIVNPPDSGCSGTGRTF